MCLCVCGCVPGVSAEVTPELQGASPGSDVVLTCSHNSADSSAVSSWSRSDGTAVIDGGRYSVSSDGSTLTIRSAVASDSGVYVCTVVTSEDGTVVGRGEVIVGEFSFVFCVGSGGLMRQEYV